MKISREHDVDTDRFTVLAAYFCGWHQLKEDVISAKEYIYDNKVSIRRWKKDPSPNSGEYVKEYRRKLKDSRRQVFLLTKYINSLKGGLSLNVKEDKELFKLFIERKSFFSPESINEWRCGERAMLELISDIRSYIHSNAEIFNGLGSGVAREYKIKSDNYVDYFEQLCIKSLERPNELTKIDGNVHANLWTGIIWTIREIPELKEFYLKYKNTIDALREPEDASTWGVDFLRSDLDKSHLLDVNTDNFTELAEVFYGFIDIEDDIEYLMQQEMRSSDTTASKKEIERLIYLLKRYINNNDTSTLLNSDENKELFELYTTYINKRSPAAINAERDRIRAIFILISRIKACDSYKIEWDIREEKYIAEECIDNLGYLCKHLLLRPKEVTSHEYKAFKVLFNLVANLATTIPQYKECWDEYLKTDGVHKNFALQLDSIDNIIERSYTNDLNTDRITILTKYLYEYRSLNQFIKYIRYQIDLNLDFIKYYNNYPEMQSNNTWYISIVFSMIREKRRFISLLYLFIKSKEKGKPISENTDKALYRLYMSYNKHDSDPTIEEERDMYRAKLRLISDMINAIATDSLTWTSDIPKDRLIHYLNSFMMLCKKYLEYPDEANESDYLYDRPITEFIVNVARTNEGLKKCWKKYMNALNIIHDRYHSKKDKRITMSSEHDVKTDRFTELTEYFYGFDNQQDSLQYFRNILAENEKEIEYYKENPDKKKFSMQLYRLEDDAKYRKPMVALMAKYLKGKRLTLEEDRKLFQFYVEHRAIASPMEINRQRERNRNLLSLISKMKNTPRYAAFDLSKLECLCIKLLESPKEVTSSDYTEFAQLRDSVLSVKPKL